MGALRRSIGPAAALPYLHDAAQKHRGDSIGVAAVREIRKAEQAVEQ
jgi:hypothetical protein